MQAVVLVLFLAVSLSGVFGSEEGLTPGTLSIIRAIQALQTKVEELEKNQVKTLQNQVQTFLQIQSLVQVPSLVQTMETSLARVQSQVQEQSQSLISTIKSMKALQTKVEELQKNQMKTVQDQVESLVRSLVQQHNSSQVAFHAGFYPRGNRGDYGPFNKITTVKFQNIQTNIGDGYSPVTGLFTAPVRGVYVFHLTTHTFLYTSSTSTSVPIVSTVVVLKKNSDTLIHHSDSITAQDSFDSSSSVAVVTLERGDTVKAELRENSAFMDEDGRHTTFSGFLLYPL